jgi:hypothetical protein
MNESTTRPLPNLRSLNIQGRLWFDKANGNSYHAVRIWANGKHLVDIGMTYGYEDMYLHTALVWLKKWQIIPEDTEYIYNLRDSLDLYTSLNWGLKKDLYKDTQKDKGEWIHKQIIIEGLKNGEY